jgi:hypothetical protein
MQYTRGEKEEGVTEGRWPLVGFRPGVHLVRRPGGCYKRLSGVAGDSLSLDASAMR